jgi:hypothetical protein
MNARVVLSSILLLAAVGCASGSGAGSTTRQFNVGFVDADHRLRELYPPLLAMHMVSDTPYAQVMMPEDSRPVVKVDALEGPAATILRDETSEHQEKIIVTEGTTKSTRRRTQISLKSIGDDKTEISVQSSTSSKAVLIPPRDQAYEQKQMDAIAAKLKQ